MSILPTAVIIDWLEGRLDAPACDEVDARVQAAIDGQDPALAERVAWCRQFLALSATAVVADPPAEAHDAVMAMFPGTGQPAPSSRPPAGAEAQVVFDSRRDLAGVRGPGAVAEWTVVYTANGGDLAVDMDLEGGAVHVAGQLLGDDPPGGIAALHDRDGDQVATAPLDDVGQFDLGSHPPATYVIVVGAITAQLDLGYG